MGCAYNRPTLPLSMFGSNHKTTNRAVRKQFADLSEKGLGGGEGFNRSGGIEMRIETMAAMAFGVFVVAVWHGDLWAVHRVTVLEIICMPMSALDAANRCQKAAIRGDTFNIAVNTSTQQVLFDVEADQPQLRDWPRGTALLENCRVVDDSNWECARTDHLNDGEWVIRTGMMKGQFYIAKRPGRFNGQFVRDFRMALLGRLSRCVRLATGR